jgi:F-type H+-transporting ATPase subunit epsilon
LQLGVIKVRSGREEEVFTVTGGLIEVQPTIVTVLADAAERVDEIDIARAEEARKRAEERLEQGPPPGTDAIMRVEAALRRSNLRLEAARRYGRTRRRRSAGLGAPGEGEE